MLVLLEPWELHAVKRLVCFRVWGQVEKDQSALEDKQHQLLGPSWSISPLFWKQSHLWIQMKPAEEFPSQPTESWEWIDPCFKLLSLGMVSYTTINNSNVKQ